MGCKCNRLFTDMISSNRFKCNLFNFRFEFNILKLSYSHDANILMGDKSDNGGRDIVSHGGNSCSSFLNFILNNDSLRVAITSPNGCGFWHYNKIKKNKKPYKKNICT